MSAQPLTNGDRHPLGLVIERRRRELGFTIEALAQASDLLPDLLRMIELGFERPTTVDRPTLEALSKVLRIDVLPLLLLSEFDETVNEICSQANDWEDGDQAL